MDRAPEASHRWFVGRHELAAIPRGWVIVGLALVVWILAIAIGLVALGLLT